MPKQDNGLESNPLSLFTKQLINILRTPKCSSHLALLHPPQLTPPSITPHHPPPSTPVHNRILWRQHFRVGDSKLIRQWHISKFGVNKSCRKNEWIWLGEGKRREIRVTLPNDVRRGESIRSRNLMGSVHNGITKSIKHIFALSFDLYLMTWIYVALTESNLRVYIIKTSNIYDW